jgi:hypothetical protein
MSKTTNRKEAGRAASPVYLIFAVLGLVLLIAYLAYRDADVGQIPRFFGAHVAGSYFSFGGFGASLLGALIALAILLAWFGLGNLIVSLTGVRRDADDACTMNFTLAVGAGAAVWSTIWFLLGLVGGYRKPVAIVALIIGLALAAPSLRTLVARGRERAAAVKWSGVDKLLFALTCLIVLLAVIGSLAPPTAKDALFYHLALPKAFLAQGSIAPIEGNIASYFTLGTEMHSVWALLLGNFINPRVAEAAAGATLMLFFPLILLAIYRWARELGLARTWSLLAVFMFAAVPSAYYVAANSYIDLALSLYVLLALHALGHWWRSLDRRWCVIVAVFLGAALSAKLTALFVFAGVGLIVLLRAREAKDGSSVSSGRILAAGVATLILAGVLASPWYLHNWKLTGSPIFPFYMNLWKGQAPGWDVERSRLYQGINSHYGGEVKGPLDYLLNPLKISILAQPEEARYFDGVVGCAFLFGLPILIWGWWKRDLPVELKAALGVCLVMFLFWLFSSELLRYLLPVFPVLALGISAAGQALADDDRRLRRTWQISLAILSLAAGLTSFAWFLRANPVWVVLGGESRTDYLTRNIDYYPYYQLLNTQTPPDAKVWLINMRRDTYHLDRPYFSDFMFEDWTIREMVWSSRDVDELRAKIRGMGITYILARHDLLLDYAHTSIVDENRSDQENTAKLAMLKALILDGPEIVKSDKRFSLVKL